MKNKTKTSNRQRLELQRIQAKMKKRFIDLQIEDTRMCNGRVQVKYRNLKFWFYADACVDTADEFNRHQFELMDIFISTTILPTLIYLSSKINKTKKTNKH